MAGVSDVVDTQLDGVGPQRRTVIVQVGMLVPRHALDSNVLLDHARKRV